MTLNVVPGTIYHMDNLDALRGMNSSIVDLIATDPPFNTGRNRESVGGKYVDQWRWEENVHRSWMDDIRDTNRPLVEVIEAAEHAHSENLGAFLCFLSVRLLEMKRVLKDTGSIYLHCDPTASHYIKAVMDAVFGAKNFRNEIVWKRQSSNNAVTKSYGKIADYILFYVMSEQATWNQVYQELSEIQLKRYRPDSSGRLYKVENLTVPSPSPNRMFEWRGTMPKNRGWAYSREQLEELWTQGRIKTTRDGRPRLDGLIKYLDEQAPGQKAQSIWTDIPRVGNTSKARTGYPDQKPVSLYERIVAASSNPGDLVLDPFCGCGTTLVAARNLDRQSIGIDRNDDAKAMILCNLASMKKAEVDEFRQKSQHTDPGWIDRILAKHEASFTDVPPERTDEDTEAIPGLPQVHRRQERALFSHAEMKDMLLDQWGLQCWGCEFSLPDAPRNRRYFDLDHINPKSGGGTNHLDNRAVLCGPCNGQKSDKLTLVALRIDVLGGRKQANAHPIDLKQTATWARTQELEAFLAREREEKPLFTR